MKTDRNIQILKLHLGPHELTQKAINTKANEQKPVDWRIVKKKKENPPSINSQVCGMRSLSGISNLTDVVISNTIMFFSCS